MLVCHRRDKEGSYAFLQCTSIAERRTYYREPMSQAAFDYTLGIGPPHYPMPAIRYQWEYWPAHNNPWSTAKAFMLLVNNYRVNGCSVIRSIVKASELN